MYLLFKFLGIFEFTVLAAGIIAKTEVRGFRFIEFYSQKSTSKTLCSTPSTYLKLSLQPSSSECCQIRIYRALFCDSWPPPWVEDRANPARR